MKYVLVLFCIVSMFGCNEDSIVSVGNAKKIVVDIEKTDEALELSRFFTPEYIVLESTNNSLIGDIDKVFITDSTVYVLDSRVTNSLYLFNRDGRFLRYISSKGKGPGEYLELDDFEVDEANKEIHLYCGDQKRILIYNMAGEFKRLIKLTDFGYIFNLFPSGRYLTLNVRNLRNVSFWNKDGERTTFYNHKDDLFWLPMMSVSKYKNTCLINFPFYGDIYQVEDEKLIKKFYIDFQSKNYPMETIKEVTKFEDIASTGAYAKLSTFAYYSDVLCFTFTYNKRVLFGLFLNDKNVLSLAKQFIVEGLSYSTEIKGICKDGIILSSDASFLLEYGQRVLSDDFVFPGYYHSLTENSNPVIALLKTKNINEL